MKKRLFYFAMVVSMFCLFNTSCCYAEENSESSKTDMQENLGMEKVKVSFNGHTYIARLSNNDSAQTFAEMLKIESLTVYTHDYGNFEKVGNLNTFLPRNDKKITTSTGDIILYQGNQISVYYAKNTWNFTLLGRIDNPTGLKDALGSGDVAITFSLIEDSP